MAASPNLGVLIGGEQMSPSEMAAWARRVEDAGFESVWVTEAWWDAATVLALVGEATSRIRIGSACALLVRDPQLAQLEFTGVDVISGGRLALGVASGHAFHGGDRPIRRMREYVESLRLMMASKPGELLDYPGEIYPLERFQRYTTPVRERVPILIGAAGEQMMRLAGRLGDGFIGAALNSAAHYDEVVIPRIEAGLADAGRTRDGFEIATVHITSVHEDRDEARRRARPHVGLYMAAPHFAPLLEFHGWTDVAKEIAAAAGAGDFARAGKLVPEEALDTIAVAGSPDEVRAGIADFARNLDTVLLYPPSWSLPKREVEEGYAALIDAFGRNA